MPKLFDEFDLDLKKLENVYLYSDDGTSNLTGGGTGGTGGTGVPSPTYTCSCICLTQIFCRK